MPSALTRLAAILAFAALAAVPALGAGHRHHGGHGAHRPIARAPLPYASSGGVGTTCRTADGTPYDPDIIGGPNHVGDGGPTVNLGPGLGDPCSSLHLGGPGLIDPR